MNEIRELSDFNAIQLNGNMNTIISFGNEYSCTIESDDNIIPIITTEATNHGLIISIKGSYSTQNEIDIYLDFQLNCLLLRFLYIYLLWVSVIL